jgi:serine/threonine protein kinase
MSAEHPTPAEARTARVDDAGSVDERSSLVRRIDRRGHAPGDVLAGKYQIVGLLGEGGMGTVWRAHSLLLDIDVAIKVLHRERADLHAAERLLREARATAKLGHPAIVRAFDLGETDAGEPFLVMELLQGTSLAGWMQQRGRMPATQAVQMLLPIAGALAAAHKQGIVHRDIKPENIIIVPDEDGTYLPKIVDFGIAKLMDGGSRGEVLTQSGMILGSLEYMSPEQAEGREEVGEQTDVWALCVVLYELIAGRRPFEGPTLTALMFALYTRAPTPTTQFSAGDADLWDIIERGLHKSPSGRWPSMRSLGQALASWAVQHGITSDAAGMALERHWLARTSDAPMVRESSGHIYPASITLSPSSPHEAAASRTPITSGEPVVASPAVLQRSVVSTVPAFAEPAPRRRAAARLFGTVAAVLIIVPVLVLGGLHTRRGSDSANAGEPPAADAVPVATDAVPAATEAPITVSIPTAPPVPAASSVPAAEAPLAPTIRPRLHRPPPTVPPSRRSSDMPLPATPNF